MRALLLAAAATAGVLLASCTPKTHQLAACTPGDNVLCDINGPEDIEIIPGSRWLMTTGKHGDARLVLFDPKTREIKPLLVGKPTPTETENFPRCGAPPDQIGTGSFHLSNRDDGTFRLLVNNRGRIERYSMAVNGDDFTIGWEGCVKTPDELSPNDLAALGDDGIVISHTYDRPRTFWTDVQLFFGREIGGAFRWTKTDGWSRIPNSQAAFANGMQVDQKTQRIYIASMYNQRIIAINADGSNRQVSEKVPQQNDNLSWTEDGKLIGVGNTSLPIIGTRLCRDLNGPPCTFPFAVIEMDPKTLAFKTIYRMDDETIPGASIAVLKDGTIYLGSTWGDRITMVKPIATK